MAGDPGARRHAVSSVERFDPVIEMVQNAADDPAVLAIKQTLPDERRFAVVRALARSCRERQGGDRPGGN